MWDFYTPNISIFQNNMIFSIFSRLFILSLKIYERALKLIIYRFFEKIRNINIEFRV
jgi:hypothetical protein